jgi:hypothetical protein
VLVLVIRTDPFCGIKKSIFEIRWLKLKLESQKLEIEKYNVLFMRLVAKKKNERK